MPHPPRALTQAVPHQAGSLVVFDRAKQVLLDNLPRFYRWVPNITSRVIRWLQRLLRFIALDKIMADLNVTCLGKQGSEARIPGDKCIT
jgi:hypothetical protein